MLRRAFAPGLSKGKSVARSARCREPCCVCPLELKTLEAAFSAERIETNSHEARWVGGGEDGQEPVRFVDVD